ncbi:MAG: hypothetical protein ATN36_07355 [Epulopiscium sp. Nele67-Bin005]|nr:MAG: hypothetical protein ATN36_07355 [Epulopiscium sp. Nele67-Bin005]
MKKFAKRFALLSLTGVVATTSLVGCGSSSNDNNSSNQASAATGPSGTTVIAISSLNGIFSPFFSQTSYDRVIHDAVHEYLIEIDRDGFMIPNLASVEMEEITTDGNIQTVYTFKLKEGLTFSDGESITADDIIFNYKVYADPTYDGALTVSSLPIVGLQDYKYGDATEISGIKKIDDLTVEVTIDGVDPSAIHSLRIAVLPEHYYGEGFVKGDLSGVKSKNGTPMGAGPYIFEDYSNNVVSLKFNETYFQGTPNIEKIKFQLIDSANAFEAVRSGQVDIADPSASPDMIKMVEDAGLHYELIDHNAYGYVGINAERIPDINVRKGLMHLMNRGPSIESYYGPYASVIERPMTQVSWAYPSDAEEVYGYDKQKAMEYFELAGYEDVNGKLMKDGEQLRIEVGIAGNGIMDHPVAPLLMQMKVDLENMGAVFEVMDTDTSLFFDKIMLEEWDMWTAGWTGSADPDLYRYFHTDGSTAYHAFSDAEIDAILEASRQTLDTNELSNLYAEALDMIMEHAIIMPVYQRQNLYVFNPEMIDVYSLPENMTPYYLFYDELQNLQMK